MRFIREFLSIWLLLITCCSCAAEQEIYTPMFKCSKKLREPYGICTHINRTGARWEYDSRERDLAMTDSIGAAWLRTDWDWHFMIEEGSKELNFSKHDNMMTSVGTHGKKIFGILTIHKEYGGISDWADYVSQTVKNYSGRCDHWEIINEADLKYRRIPGFCASEYLKFLKVGCKSVKMNNKHAKVLFSGIAYMQNDFVDSVLSQGVSRYFDIMTIHHYTSKVREPEEFIDYYKIVDTKLRKYSIDKPVWLTETGGSSTRYIMSEETQATRLPRIFLISFACGIDKVFWYKTRSNELDTEDPECHYGLWHKDYTPKPAFYTYQTLTQMCPDKSTRPKLFRRGTVYVASWKRPDGKKVWALWTSKTEEQVMLKVSGTFRCYDDTGKLLMDMMPDNFRVTPSVTYIVGAKSVKE